MKKLLLTVLQMSSLIIHTTYYPKQASTAAPIAKAKAKATFTPDTTTTIYNIGNAPLTINSISYLFFENTTPVNQSVSYNTIIQPPSGTNLTGKKFSPTISYTNLAESTQFSKHGASGVNQININKNHQTITIAPASNDNIYLTNKDGVWKQTTQPKTLVTPKATSSTRKSIVPVAKTATLKSAAVSVQAKKNIVMPKSKTAKKVTSILEPKDAVIAKK